MNHLKDNCTAAHVYLHSKHGLACGNCNAYDGQTSKWIIEDWLSRHVYTDMTFDSFEAARDFISEQADFEAGQKYPAETPEALQLREECYTGICEDLYAIEVKL